MKKNMRPGMFGFSYKKLWKQLIVIFFCSACSNFSKEKNLGLNNDLEYAIELSLESYTASQSNNGYGKVMEIQSVDPDDQYFFEKEHNTDWYKLTIPDTVSDDFSLSFSIDPEDPSEDFDFLLFQDAGENFQDDLVKGKIKPVRSNMAKNDNTIGVNTGLSCEAFNNYERSISQFTFSKSLPVKPGEVFYLVVDNLNSGGKGYTINFSSCLGDAAQEDNDYFSKLKDEKPGLNNQADYYSEEPGSSDGNFTTKLIEGADYVVVGPKNTVFSISNFYGMTVDELIKLNKLKSNKITIGQRLKVKKHKDTSSDYNHNVVYTYTTGGEYIVNQKNTLYSIAKMYGMTVDELLELNGLNSNSLKIGQVLKVKIGEPSDDNTITSTANNDVYSDKAASKGNTYSDNTPKERENKVIPQIEAVVEEVEKAQNAEAIELAKKEQEKAKGKPYYLFLNVLSELNKPVSGDIFMVDFENTKISNSLPANQLSTVYVKPTDSKQKTIIFDVFGYRKTDLDINLEKVPTEENAETVFLLKDTIIINQVLERYRKNDIVVMYHVFFYDDAAIMLPKSKFELNSLLDLMKENPKVKILIHGHTNGNKMGKIVSLGEGETNYFTVTKTSKESYGSAARLSELRAEIIKFYLVSQGIEESRIDIKGWGGKKPLYGPKSEFSHKNKRVEVEILED